MPAQVFVPAPGYSKRREFRDAWRSFLTEHSFDLHVTLMFNRPTTLEGARKDLKAWLARLDEHWLGRAWSRRPSEERTFAIAFVEHPESNLHLHVLVRIPPSVSLSPRKTRVMAKAWKK